MKRILVALALTIVTAASSAFAGEPALPTDVDTWERYIRTCTPKPDTRLTITSYRKQTETVAVTIEVVDKGGEKIAQIESLFRNNHAGITFITKNIGGWVTHEFAFNEDGVMRFNKKLETTLGVSMVKYLSCNEK